MPSRPLAALRALVGSTWVRWAFLVAVLVFGVDYLAGNWDDIGPAVGRIGALPLAGAFLASLVGLVGSMLAYRALLADMGSPLPVTVAARIFFVGQLGKYIPGSLWPVIAQMEMGKAAGVPRQRSAAAITLTILIYLGAGLLLGGVALPFGADADPALKLLVLLAPVFLLALHPRVLNPLLRRVTALARREPPECPLSGRGVATAVGWSVASWVAFGAMVALVAHDLGAQGARTLPLAVGGFALAWSAGFLVVFLPAGVGLREAVLAALLSPVLEPAEAIAVSFVARLLMTAGDVLTAGVAVLAWRRTRSSPAAASVPVPTSPGPTEAPRPSPGASSGT